MKKEILKLQNIILNQESESKDRAIERAGDLLVKDHYVTPKYIEGMKERGKQIYNLYRKRDCHPARGERV